MSDEQTGTETPQDEAQAAGDRQLGGNWITKDEALLNAVAERFAEKVTVETETPDGSVKLTNAEDLVEVATYCRDDLRLDTLHLITGVDYLDEGVIQVVYNLESFRDNRCLTIKVDVPRDEPIVPSLVDLWAGADWMERETYDLIGVLFEGHPNLRRILCSEDWEGHPLRKDYVLPAYYHGIPNIFFLEQLTDEQKQLLFGEMSEENRRLIYGE